MRRCTMLLGLCLVLAACGGGSVHTLPESAKAELADYITGHYGAARWRVQSAQQAPNPDNVLDSHFPDEVWCVVISPALVDPGDPLHRQRDHFLVAHAAPDWYVQAGPCLPHSAGLQGCGLYQRVDHDPHHRCAHHLEFSRGPVSCTMRCVMT